MKVFGSVEFVAFCCVKPSLNPPHPAKRSMPAYELIFIKSKVKRLASQPLFIHLDSHVSVQLMQLYLFLTVNQLKLLQEPH